MIIEGTVQLPKPVADLHLSVGADHSLISEHHEPIASHVFFYIVHGLSVHRPLEVYSVHFHSEQWERSHAVVSTEGCSVASHSFASYPWEVSG